MDEKYSFEGFGLKGEGLLVILFIMGLILHFFGIFVSLGKFLIILTVVLMIFEKIISIFHKINGAGISIFSRKKHSVSIKSKFHTGHGPTSHARQTKWNYKNHSEYYFVPLLSYGYDTVSFKGFCGPYCHTCDHLLSVADTWFGSKFMCTNCLKRFRVPREVLSNYENKLFEYFEMEYSKGSLKEYAKFR